MPLFLKDLETIVNIDSGSENLPGVEDVGMFFKKRFDALGLKTKMLFLASSVHPA